MGAWIRFARTCIVTQVNAGSNEKRRWMSWVDLDMNTKTLRFPLRAALGESTRRDPRARFIAIFGWTALCFALTSSLYAQDENKWVGKSVVQKYANFSLKIDDRNREVDFEFGYEVRAVNEQRPD